MPTSAARLAVLGHRHDRGAGDGARQEQVQQHHQAERGGDDQQALHRRGEPEELDHLAVRRGHAVEVRAPQRLRAGFEEQQDADGGDHVVDLGALRSGWNTRRSASIDSTATTAAAPALPASSSGPAWSLA